MFKNFEYEVIEFRPTDLGKNIKDRLNKLGHYGWELMYIEKGPIDISYAIFMREIR